ncbi:hypothetical protein ACJX0J_020117, partial [Zea mays]
YNPIDLIRMALSLQKDGHFMSFILIYMLLASNDHDSKATIIWLENTIGSVAAPFFDEEIEDFLWFCEDFYNNNIDISPINNSFITLANLPLQIAQKSIWLYQRKKKEILLT